MSLLDQFGDIFNQYNAGSTPSNPDAAIQHYQQVATQAPPSALSGALAAVFRSPQTGTFGQNISSMFSQSDPNQRAGILNTLLSSGGSNILAHLGLSPATTQVSPQQATQISPATIEQAATAAQNEDPSIIERASGFYAQHPTLVKALGAGAAILAMQHLSRG
jgi:stage V sporulation protein SpoVS